MAIERAEESKELMALRRAVAKALHRKSRLGQYAVVWRDGRPVRLEPEDMGAVGDYEMDPAAPMSLAREPGAAGGEGGESRK